MALQDKVASRYAKAILDAVPDKAKARRVLEELEKVAVLIAGHSELQLLLSSSAFTGEERSQVLGDLADKLKLLPETKQTLIVIAMLGRTREFRAIVNRLHLLHIPQPIIVHRRNVLCSHYWQQAQ